MNTRAPDGHGEPEADDPVMLAVLANRGGVSTPLSTEQERLLGDWVAGRLAPDDAGRAAAIVKQNALAAEHVLELRLQAASSESPPIPRQLETHILEAIAASKATSTSGGWWRSFGRWQWTSIAGAAALASILAVAGVPVLQQMMSGSPLQVAMVTISDREPLFESSDLRMRGTTPSEPVIGQRFRDIEMPTALLKDVFATTGQPRSAASREIEGYVLGAGLSTNSPVRVVVDSALRQPVEAAARDRMPVRVYDLNDPRSANVRSLIGLPPGGERAFLITVRP
jgi:hypothetical protein